MVTFYSQHGEDVLLNEIFKEKENGFFVEVGCIDGKRFSNTLLLEEKGWKGLCVEAHAGYIEVLVENRPNSVICHCAAGEKDEDGVTFYANSRGSLSTLDASQEADFKKRYKGYFTGFEKQLTPKRMLETLFIENNISEIDVLSLDIEGYEVEALKGLNLKKYKPTVLIIESDNLVHEAQLDEILIPNSYVKAFRLGANIFYFADFKFVDRIIGKTFDVELYHTANPFDQDDDYCVKANISTRKGIKKIFDLLRSKLTQRKSYRVSIY